MHASTHERPITSARRKPPLPTLRFIGLPPNTTTTTTEMNSPNLCRRPSKCRRTPLYFHAGRRPTEHQRATQPSRRPLSPQPNSRNNAAPFSLSVFFLSAQPTHRPFAFSLFFSFLFSQALRNLVEAPGRPTAFVVVKQGIL